MRSPEELRTLIGLLEEENERMATQYAHVAGMVAEEAVRRSRANNYKIAALKWVLNEA